MNYDLKSLEEDSTNLYELKNQTLQSYLEAGNIYPQYSMHLIQEVYNRAFYRESEKATKAGKSGLSDKIMARMDILKTITEIKLLNQAMEAFKVGKSFTLSFDKGMPDESTKDFFDLSDTVGEHLSKTRTGEIRLPEYMSRGIDIQSYKLTITGDREVQEINGEQTGIIEDTFISQTILEGLSQ